MNLRTLASARTRGFRPVSRRRPALYLGVATAGALMVNVLSAGEPAAHADAQPTSVSIAAELGIPAQETEIAHEEAVRPLEQLTASRSERDADQVAAAQAQAAADQAVLDAQAEAARVAAE
ncbi:hypothetical protein E4P38_21980, partial [Blastococcus sp. CT_GayMR16]